MAVSRKLSNNCSYLLLTCGPSSEWSTEISLQSFSHRAKGTYSLGPSRGTVVTFAMNRVPTILRFHKGLLVIGADTPLLAK